MSPDNTTITRAEAIRRRKEEEQSRRGKLMQKNVSRSRSSGATKVDPGTKTGRSTARGASTVSSSRLRHRYDIAMSVPHGNTRNFNAKKTSGFSFSWPRIRYGPRLFSFLLVIFCALDIFLMMNMDPFVVRSAHITGNKRISIQEIESASGAVNKPAAFVNPLQVEHNIRIAFPDIENVQVEVTIPGSIIVSVSERKPVIAWEQDGKTLWVDSQGYAFPPRGLLDGIPTITATGDPVVVAQVEETTPETQVSSIQAFLPAALTNAILTLSPHLPQNGILVFDTKYGLGWSDPGGWKVYFGHTNGDTSLKLKVYEAMIEYLGKNNIQPALISVEYPNAPFYRVEQ